MNGSAARIPLVYALLLSLTVAVMGLAFVAPSNAAGPVTYRSTTSPQPELSRSTGDSGDVSLEGLIEQKNPDLNDAPAGSTTVPSSKDPVDGDTGSELAGTDSTVGGSSDGGSSDGGAAEPAPTGGTDPTPSSEPKPEPGGSDGADTPPAGKPAPGDVVPDTSEPAPQEPVDQTNPAVPAAPSAPADPGTAPLVLDPDAVQEKVVAGSEISAKLKVSGGTDGSVFHVVSGTMPPGLTLDPNTGHITGTVRQVGEHTFTIEVVSGDQRTRQSYTIVVKERPLEIEAPPLEPARTGEKYDAVVLRTEGGEGPFTYSLKGSELVGGEPDPAPVQNSNWDLSAPHTASDMLMGSSKLLDSGPTAQGVAESKNLGPAGGLSKVGNLPAGMRLEEGVLTGKPEADAAGTYTFTIVSTDRFGSTAEQEMTITVLSDSEPVLLPGGEGAESTSPAELADRKLDDPSTAAAGVSDTGTGPAPLVIGMVLLGAGALLVFLRRRFITGTHK